MPSSVLCARENLSALQMVRASQSAAIGTRTDEKRETAHSRTGVLLSRRRCFSLRPFCLHRVGHGVGPPGFARAYVSLRARRQPCSAPGRQLEIQKRGGTPLSIGPSTLVSSRRRDKFRREQLGTRCSWLSSSLAALYPLAVTRKVRAGRLHAAVPWCVTGARRSPAQPLFAPALCGTARSSHKQYTIMPLHRAPDCARSFPRTAYRLTSSSCIPGGGSVGGLEAPRYRLLMYTSP